MKVKTDELIGRALDWAVAECEGVDELVFSLYYEPTEATDFDSHGKPEFHYSTMWHQAGPIIERESVSSTNFDDYPKWTARHPSSPISHTGGTLLVAAMRAYVYSKLGEEINIPEEIENED